MADFCSYAEVSTHSLFFFCGKWKIFQARKAWKELGLVEEQQINFDEFKRALDLLDITLLEPRAMRLFEATDLDQSECIGIIEFQVALMMNDGIQIPVFKKQTGRV